MAQAPRDRFDDLTVTLHWIMAALVVVLGALGLLLKATPFPSAAYDRWHMWHRSLGEAAFLIILVSLWWRRRRPVVAALPDVSWRAAAAAGVKAAIVSLLVFVPAVKLARGAFGLGWAFFGIEVAAPFAANKPASHVLSDLHEYGAYALLALSGVHALAALWHGAVLKDGVLVRMTPWRPRRRG
jgi:cytochrome b561